MSNNLPKGFHKISDSSSPVVDVTSLDLSLLTGERGDGILVKEPYNPDVVVDGGKKKKRGRPRKEETDLLFLPGSEVSFSDQGR